MSTILIVEDDPVIRWNMRETLEQSHTILETDSAEDALQLFSRQPVHLCILDCNLPGRNGFELCQSIRKISTVPVIFVTVNDDEDSILQGLDVGGDDYITKPFSLRELEGRVRAHLRRSGYQQQARSGWMLDESHCSLLRNGEVIALSRTEYAIVRILLSNAGCLVPRERILERVWDEKGSFVENNTLSVTISRLRKKVTDEAKKCPIQTVPGIGYRWKED